jgi:hypothetical protein
LARDGAWSHPVDPTEQTACPFLAAQEFVRHSVHAAVHHHRRPAGTALRRKRLPGERHRNWNIEGKIMEDRDSRSIRLRDQWRKANESEATVAVIFAGIAALFVAGIAAAFIYAKDTTFTQTANAPAPPAASSAPASPGAGPGTSPSAGAPAAQSPETTGSGAINRTPPKQDPREDEQRERP